MFFNRSRFILILVVLLVAGFISLATPALAAVVPRLAVVDELADVTGETNTTGIQVYGIRGELVSFELTVTFQKDNNTPDNLTDDVNTEVTGFGDEDGDIVLFAADGDDRIIENGATSLRIQRNTDGSVYTTTITARGNVAKVFIQVPAGAAKTPTTIENSVPIPGAATGAAESTALHNTLIDNTDPDRVQLVVNILRSAAPPLALTSDKFVRGDTPFTVTLTSTKPITLTSADLKVTDGYLDSIVPDTARRVWTLTIVPLPGRAKIIVEAASNGAYIFQKGTFTVDTTGPVATIAGAPSLSGGSFPMTIAFNESLQAGTTLLASEINVIGGTITSLTPIPGSNVYSAILTPNPAVKTVIVQVKTGAVADVGGVQNAATPSPAHTFTVTPTAAPPVTTPPATTPGRGSDDVTISEIMFASDGGTNDIQWIELSNGSKTQTVALDAGAGWELKIENYDDQGAANAPLSGTINFKNKGRVKTIPPEESVLIVSSSGRNSDNTRFAATRVFKVYSELPDEFGMRTRRDTFLHPTQGFHIELVDGSNNSIDEVGNLDGRTRTADAPAWKLPNGWTADGDRSSIIRRHREYRNGRYFNKGIAQDGTKQNGWILALNTAFLDYSKNTETWYGSSNDYGTPGIRAAGHPLPVQLSQFRPDLTETGTVVIQWTTESEVDNAGFNILRSQTKTGEFKRINAQLIPGAGTTAERNTYTWTDTTAKPNVVYYYQIEDVSLDGERQTLATVRLRGFVSAKGKLTTQWGELKRSRD